MMEPKDFFRPVYTTSVVADHIAVNPNVVTQWVARGFIMPEERSYGSGGRHKFSMADVCLLKLFSLLNRRGFSRSAAGQLIEKERSLLKEQGGIFFLWFAKLDLERIRPGRRLVEIDSGRTLLRDKIPSPLYLGFLRENGDKIKVVFIGDEDRMRNMFWSLRQDDDLYLVNIGKIVEEIIAYFPLDED